MDSKPIVRNVIRLLDERSIPYRLVDHEPVYTSEQASRVRGFPLKSGVKAMALRTAEGRYLLALMPADRKVDLRKIKELEHSRKVSLASPEDVLAVTGCEIGSAPPFGHRTPLKTYIDQTIFNNDTVNFNIGSHSQSIRMKGADLQLILKGILL